MFREVARIKQQLTNEECIALLKNSHRGVLSVLTDDEYPYGMPMNHYYDEDENILYFHGGRHGHKIDSLLLHPKVSYCVFEQVPSEEWYHKFQSVIVFGKVSFVVDVEKALEISRKLSYKFTDDTNYIEEEIKKDGNAVLCFAIHIEHITGKNINER